MSCLPLGQVRGLIFYHYPLINKLFPKIHLLLKEVMPQAFSSLEPAEERDPSLPPLPAESFSIPEPGPGPCEEATVRWQGSCVCPGWGQGARTGEFSSSQFQFNSSAHSSWPRSKLSRTVHASCGVTSACVCVLGCVCSRVPGQSCWLAVFAASPSSGALPTPARLDGTKCIILDI